MAVDQQEGWKPDRTVAEDAQHVTNDFAGIVPQHNHIGPLARGLLTDFEQLPAMEDVVSFQLGQFAALAIDGCRQSFHIAKLRNYFIIDDFFEGFFVTLPPNQSFFSMTAFKDLAQKRRSHRKFTTEEIDPEDLKLILRAALMSPTSKSQRAWQFVVVDDKLDIEKLADAKNMGSQFLKDAPVAIVVLGDPMQNDCWVEDGSIAAISMQYQAEDLGLGTCWIQMRGRGLDDGTTADTVIRGVLDIPDNLNCLCILAVGHWTDERKPQAEDRLKWENVHLNKF